MKKVISIFFASAFALGIAGPAMGESRLITAAGITQGTADTIYVNESGDTMTGPLLMPDGSSGSPSVAFASESGTGWFLAKALRHAWTIAGTGTIMTLDTIAGLVIDVDVTLGNAAGDTVTSKAGIWAFPNTTTFTNTSGGGFVFDSAAGYDFTGPIEFNGTIDVVGTDGVEFTPGAGVDMDVLGLLIAGAPKLQWLTASSSFNFTKALGIGGAVDASAIFSTTSTTQGSIPSPPMTSAQRDAIGSPLESLTAYDLTNNVWNFYNGTTWRAVLNVAASTLTVGEIPFAISASGVDCDPNLFWDNTDKQLGIGTNTPDNSAALDVASTTAGSLPAPRMTTAQRNAIGTPADGLQVDDSDLNALTRYNGSGYDVFSMNVPTIKSGAKTSGSFTGNPRTATVTFGTAFPDANYSVTAIGVDGRGWTIDSQVAGSFVINSNASSALTGSVSWTAIAHNDP